MLIVSRFFSAFDLPLQAGLKVLWNHDILDMPEELAKRLGQIDMMLMLSRFHARDYLDKLPSARPRSATRSTAWIWTLMDQASAGASIEPGKLTYVSRPERGLKLLLGEIWPELKRRHPQLRLDICGYEVSAKDTPPALQKLYGEVQRMIDEGQDVRSLGPLPKERYYAHLASCEFLLYPCVFPEISCIAALEAQALGTPVITSDSFALSQTVRAGEFLVQGKPGSPGYVREYIDRVSRFIVNPQEAARAAAQVRRIVRGEHQWSNIARQWEELFIDALSDRCRDLPEAVAASLVINGDRQAAASLLGQKPARLSEASPPPDPKEEALLQIMRQMILAIDTPMDHIGVAALDDGRTARELQAMLPEHNISEIDLGNCRDKMDMVVVRDILERQPEPAEFLAGIMHNCSANGRLLLCVASGAWPLLSAGHAGRLHDLDGEDLSELLANLSFELRHVPQGLVRLGDMAYSAGRWLAMVRAGRVSPAKTDPNTRYLQGAPSPSGG